MYGSDTRAQNLNVQFGRTFGIFGADVHNLVTAPRFKFPFSQTSNKNGCSEPKFN